MKSSDSPIYIPEQGDIVWIDFTPQVGREQAGSLYLAPAKHYVIFKTKYLVVIHARQGINSLSNS